MENILLKVVLCSLTIPPMPLLCSAVQISSYIYTVILTPLLVRKCLSISRERANEGKKLMTQREKAYNKPIDIIYRR